jgi:hypothetical protein
MGWRAAFVGRFRDNHCRGFVSERAFEAGNVVPPEVVILRQNGDLSVGPCLQDVPGVSAAFGLDGSIVSF